MGDGADRHHGHGGGQLSGHLSDIAWADAAATLWQRHQIGSIPDLDALLERLEGLAIRDVGLPLGNAATAQRQHLMRAARAIQASATEAIGAADKAVAGQALHAAITRFVESIRVAMGDGRLAWSAPMLEQVYAIDYIDPAALDLPAELEALSIAATMSASDIAERPDVVMGLSNLPLRSRARRGTPRDAVLEEAVLACREYWIANGGGSWARSNISLRSSRTGNQHCDLKGAAERFLHDMVTAAGLPNDLSKLNSAWNSADRRSPRKPQTA